MDTIIFYWLCARDAARGTIEKANSWFWVVGVPIVAAAGAYWDGELFIPDHPQGFITFMVVTVAVTWVVFFIFRFLGAPARLYAQVKTLAELLQQEIQTSANNPALEAQRQLTAAITAHGDAIKNRPQGEPPGAIALAGIVNTLMDRALQHGFKISALRPDDPFTPLYEGIKNSIDPVWIDGETNQLRRDFLQYCAIVGFKERSDFKDLQSDRAELRGYGLKLIANLTGTATTSPDIWKSAPDAVEAFADPSLIAERDKWKQTFEDATLRGYEAQDKIAALQKQMGGILGLDGTGELGVSQRKLQVAAMQSDMAAEELRRAWDALRTDIHAKLSSGNLVARGFHCPHVVGSSEVVIPASEWRVLFFENVKSEASSKTSGDALYEGIVIRKKPAA